MKNPIDTLVGFISPQAGLSRAAARRRLNLVAQYDATKPGRNRKTGYEHNDGTTAAAYAHRSLRSQARWLEENHDMAKGIIDELVKKCLGRNGIGFDSMPRNADGTVNKDLAKQINRYLKDWFKRPEVSHRLNWSRAQRLAFRTWLRDGDVLTKKHEGTIKGLNHGTLIPFSIELLEPDFLPDESLIYNNGIQGIETNGWGQPIFYNLYDVHPGNQLTYAGKYKTRRIPANRIIHCSLITRIGQLRGVSIFAPIFTRLEDIKDIEESERIAARIAAAMAAYIKKTDSYDEDDEKPGETREFSIHPGSVWDNLKKGEEVGSIQSNRPNIDVTPFIDAQIRRATSGTWTSYSSVSRNYNGTYSAQRQELVESYEGYAILADEFTDQWVAPIIESAIRIGIASGQIIVPKDVDTMTITDGDFIMQSMPWIDPKKELEGIEGELRNELASRAQVIRRRGQNPDQVREAIKIEREQDENDGITPDYRNREQPINPNKQENDDEEESNNGDRTGRSGEK
jgi:lambda family phage portal protein